jgi:hypothetical protein
MIERKAEAVARKSDYENRFWDFRTKGIKSPLALYEILPRESQKSTALECAKYCVVHSTSTCNTQVRSTNTSKVLVTSRVIVHSVPGTVQQDTTTVCVRWATNGLAIVESTGTW